MSRTPEELLKLAADFDNVATRALVVTAKKKEKKKLDPKAKVRNRGTVCVSAEQAKDKKDHFPINDEAQARNALARVQQLSSAPWYKGSLEGLKALVSRKVKAKYPGINVGGKDSKKKSSEYYDNLLNKFGQGWTDKLKNLNPFGGTKAAPPPPGGYGLVHNSPPFEDNSGPAIPPKAMNAPAEKEQQAPSFVKEVFDTRTNKWYPANDAELSSSPEGTRARYHTGDEYVYFTKSKTGWNEEGAPTGGSGTTTSPKGSPGGQAVSAIPFRADVRAAQIQFNKLNKQNGNYAAPIDEDGKLGPKTKSAFSGYRPGVDIEAVIKDLSEQGMTWNVKTPEPKKPWDPGF